jgi:hypothetical protein
MFILSIYECSFVMNLPGGRGREGRISLRLIANHHQVHDDDDDSETPRANDQEGGRER